MKLQEQFPSFSYHFLRVNLVSIVPFCVQIKRVPREWNDELEWLISSTKGKGKRHAILKLAAAETLYGIWRYRNDKSFGNTVDNTKIADNIIDMIVYRGWYSGYLRDHIANLMMG